MSDLRPLESLQALHGELLAVCQHRFEGLQALEVLLEENKKAFKQFLDKKSRNQQSRTAIGTRKITLGEGDDAEEYQINSEFLDDTLKVADELDLDELEAARLLLDASAEGDPEAWGRPLWECGMLRFHQERRFLLDCMRLLIEIAADEDIEDNLHDVFGGIVEHQVFGVPEPGAKAGEGSSREIKIVPKCTQAMLAVRQGLQSHVERMTAKSMLQQASLLTKVGEQQEVYEFVRISMVEQHELLAVILCSAIDKRHAEVKDFKEFLAGLKKADRYDHMLVHMFPILGTYITVFGSSEGIGDIQVSRDLNNLICGQSEDHTWTIPSLRAAVRAWWIAEYSGWYLDDTFVFNIPNIDLDKEDEERTKQFLEALKDGAFDFLLSVAADCKSQDWQDPSRLGMRQWLQRKSPALSSDYPWPFTPYFQKCLMVHLEVLIDASISNLPDILRKLRTEEDEQRQLSQTHEQDLDLERFLIIIAYAYEGRPDAAMSFWEDPESNLAGFLQWASRRASTPLVSAFCEMLQALSDNEECATAAHTFLLDEGHHSSGKMKRSQSLTWNQIFKELDYFAAKLRDRSSPAQSHTTMQRPGRPNTDQVETEPESAMMLECYLRLIGKLATESEVARHKLLFDETFVLAETLFRLASSLVPARLRSCAFYVLKALMTRKSQQESDTMWRWTDSLFTGMMGLQIIQGGPARSTLGPHQDTNSIMEAFLAQFSEGFEEPNALVQFLTSLVQPTEEYEGLRDSLPFPEDLGAHNRIPGIEIYADFVIGHIFATKSKEIGDSAQVRFLRLSCLDFAMTSLATFNEDLIVLGNETNITIDQAISTSDLATYVRLHPFARVMEWMFNEKVIKGLMETIHQDSAALSMAGPDSPLVESILRAVEVILKVLELQDTYLNLVRPLIRAQPAKKRRDPVANAAFACFEDGIMNHLTLVVDLGRLCALQNPPLTLACLKLLEKISTSSKIISAWNPDSGRAGHRNKAIVQLEKNGENETIAGTLSGEISAVLDPILEAEAPNYSIKIFILDFLYECLKATPDKPTIGHLLLGFHCDLNALSVEPRGAFDSQKSLFHNLLTALIGLVVYQEERGGMRGYLIALKYRILRVLQILWSSPLSSQLVIEELRVTNFLFHMLLQEVQISPGLLWDGVETTHPEFPLSDSAVPYINFLGSRAMILEYVGKELCSVSQQRIPTLKRQIFDALNGQIKADGDELTRIPNVFDFFDFLTLDGQWDIPMPEFVYNRDLDLSACAEEDPAAGIQYDIEKVKEVLALKRNEMRNAGQIIPQQELQAIEREEALLIEYLIFSNRQRQYASSRLKLLRAWTNLLLVMFESNDFAGTPKMAFLLQALQAILPSLEAYSALSAAEAYELARVAKVLLYKLDLGQDPNAWGVDKETFNIGNLISDKLFQLFQICLDSIGKWAGSAELRALYYSISYRYLTAVVDKAAAARRGDATSTRQRQRTLKAIHAHGERLLNVICDDAYGSDSVCQTAAMVLLGALVHIGRSDDDVHVIEALNRLNFVGVLVDSLKSILADWLTIIAGGNAAAEQYTHAKLALILQLCQTRQGAKFVLQANLFRALETSKVFAADPELEIDARNTVALEKHYALLVSLARIVGAAVLARGAHNVLQGRRFLTQHRMLVVHTLKRSAGIGTVGNGAQSGGVVASGEAQAKLEDRIEELAEAFMLLITATGFLEFESTQAPAENPRAAATLFH
ncbi:nucleoporin Nup186/Nup192/Nup205 [Podospora aff. communis PSN243]|uniref:Nucleoporin Nup186/Nup192/Nup205 n=1 Tax=Podospora aff. communis PSN243 TaxID=3040156 RepID=A0AAV9G5U5_9PEZI|nr:nucleoporin Nup186/Nup192/Nup205 [Podospora aff. communis PSN243]